MPHNLIIFGSPQKSSFTHKLTAAEAASLLGKTVTYNCFDKFPTPCHDCGYCKVKSGCKFNDLDSFFTDFENAEKIIFAFPIHNNSFPSPLKALIDRFQRFYNARFSMGIKPPMTGEREVTLIITAGSDSDPLPIILAQILPVFTICGCRLKKVVLLKGTDKLSENDELTPTVINY